MAAFMQDFIYKLEEGTGSRYVRYLLGLLFLLGVGVTYHFTAYRNLSLPEGMDASQVARNVARGEGFSTDLIRPLSVHLIQTRQAEAGQAGLSVMEGAKAPAPAPELDVPHPDLATPPLYPLLLSLPLKLVPERFYEVDRGTRFEIFEPDRCIAIFNQMLMGFAACLVFLLGLRLFDEPVAWVSALLFLGVDLFWQFSLSGLPTLLLTVIFLLLALVMVQMQLEARAEQPAGGKLLRLAATAGLLVGLGALTRYSFSLAIVPVVLVLLALPASRQGVLVGAAVAVFLVVFSPWLVRNYQLSGAPFGTAGFAIYQDTPRFPDDELPRQLNPQLGEVRTGDLVDKLFRNARFGVEQELPRLGGSWMAAFFLVGLLIPYRSPARGAMRLFVLACLGVFLVAQSLARTTGGGPAPPVSAENLLVIVTPLVIVYGTSLFFLLLDQTTQIPWIRYVGAGALWVVVSAPLLFTLISPPVTAVNYPPYYPPWIVEKSGRVGGDEVIMTDMPWAVAWYGQRRAVWLSLLYMNGEKDAYREDFDAVDAIIPIGALYLSGLTVKTVESDALLAWRGADKDMEDFILLRGLLVSNWEEGGETSDKDLRLLAAFRNGIHNNWLESEATRQNWNSFVVGVLMKQEVPAGFPLRAAFEQVLPEIFLTDSERITSKAIQSE